MWLNVLLFVVGGITASYFYITRKWGWFEARGIAEHNPSFPFGCKEVLHGFTGENPFVRGVYPFYKQHKDKKLVGYYNFSEPTLVVNDIEMAKNFLIKDADHFIDRRPSAMRNEGGSNKYWNLMLIALEGEKWKQMRAKMSPVFTSGKLKSMNPMINGVADEFVKYLESYAAEGKEFSGKQVCMLFTTESIATCGFGVRAGSFVDEKNSRFIKMVKKLLGQDAGKFALLKFIFMFTFPKMCSLLGMEMLEAEPTNFFIQIIRDAIKQREGGNNRRNDMIDLAMEALKDSEGGQQGDNQLSDSDLEAALMANLLLLFFAGFDTSSTMMSLILHFLALDQEIQERLYNELSDAMEAGGGEIDYNAIQTLPYFDSIVQETLRMYPLGDLERMCSKDYKMPGTDVVIPKGMLVQFSSFGVMSDEQYFPNPFKFDPDRFSAEAKKERSPFLYLPFGQGPRNCIGMRFALLQMKIALAKVLLNYVVHPCDKSPKGQLEVDPWSPSGDPKGGIWLKVEKRN